MGEVVYIEEFRKAREQRQRHLAERARKKRLEEEVRLMPPSSGDNRRPEDDLA